MRNKKNKGFMLTELVVVLFIISLILSFAYPNYKKYLKQSEVSKIQADIMIIENAITTHTLSGTQEEEDKKFNEILGDRAFFNIEPIKEKERQYVPQTIQEWHLKDINIDKLNLFLKEKHLNNNINEYAVIVEDDLKGLVIHKTGVVIDKKYLNNVYFSK